MIRAAFCSGLPIIVAANIEARNASTGSIEVRPSSSYSVWMRVLISFRYGPWIVPPSAQIRDIIFSSSSTTWNSSWISFGSDRNSTRSARRASAALGRVPQIGFIRTVPPRTVMCRSGEEPMK